MEEVKMLLEKSEITRDYLKHAEGSVLVKWEIPGYLCCHNRRQRYLSFLKEKEQGWVTAEYSMLPRATRRERTVREASKGKVTGRTHEIQRLIGRSLRSVVDLSVLGERTIWLDCDVIEADGGTRTASITEPLWLLLML